MDLQPKLHAAADMCEAGEEVNLDELAFLLRYAAGELGDQPDVIRERDLLVERLRQRLIARCELLQRSENDLTKAREGTPAELEILEAELDHQLRHRIIAGDEMVPTNSAGVQSAEDARLALQFESGR